MLRLDLHASARTLLWGVALAASIVTIAAYAAVASIEYDHSLLRAETTSENTARLLEEHALRTFDASLMLLDRLSERVEEVGLSRIGASEMEWRKVRDMERDLPQIASLWVQDRQGNGVLGTVEYPIPQANTADRPYFQAHRAGADIVIGETIRGRTTGLLSFTASRRLTGPDGSFAGVVLAAMPASYFADLYGTLDVGQNGTIGIIREDGKVIVRHPWRDEYLGGSYRIIHSVSELS